VAAAQHRAALAALDSAAAVRVTSPAPAPVPAR